MSRCAVICRSGLLGLSAALCLVSVAGWTRAHFVSDEWYWSTVSHGEHVERELTRVVTLAQSVVFVDEGQTFYKTGLEVFDRVRPMTPRDERRDAALRRDLPAGRSRGHRAFVHDGAWDDVPRVSSFLGFVGERVTSDPVVTAGRPGRRETSRTVTNTRINGHVQVYQISYVAVGVPWWFLVAVFGAGPAVAVRRRHLARGRGRAEAEENEIR